MREADHTAAKEEEEATLAASTEEVAEATVEAEAAKEEAAAAKEEAARAKAEAAVALEARAASSTAAAAARSEAHEARAAVAAARDGRSAAAAAAAAATSAADAPHGCNPMRLWLAAQWPYTLDDTLRCLARRLARLEHTRHAARSVASSGHFLGESDFF